MTQRIIVADDDTSILAALQMLFRANNFEFCSVTTPEALVEQVQQQAFSLALIDLNYKDDTTSGQEGLQLISELKAIDADLPIVVMTGYSSVDIAVEAMKLGACDFVQKPWSNERLLQIIRSQIALAQQKTYSDRLAQENVLLKQSLGNQPDIVAESPSMKALLQQIQKVAQSDMSVLFTGENGTGKSMFAEYLHQYSTRSQQAMIAVNMGAISESLFESEMFGHVKGAFTDAKDKRIGRFELAQNGTIFLDEIANISVAGQAKLLRVLEERKFEKVGSSHTLDVDVRLISASNANLDELITNGEFRQDLLYRLNTITINIPPLRERQQDITALAMNFLQTFANKYKMPIGTFSDDAITCMQSYSWPGNVRELSHVIERALFLRSDDCITSTDLNLPQNTNQLASSSPVAINFDAEQDTLEDIEKQIIKARLQQFNNNPQLTAESLGLSRSAYYRRLEKYQLLES